MTTTTTIRTAPHTTMHIHMTPVSSPLMTICTPLRITTQTTTRNTILITTTSIMIITLPTTATNPLPPTTTTNMTIPINLMKIMTTTVQDSTSLTKTITRIDHHHDWLLILFLFARELASISLLSLKQICLPNLWYYILVFRSMSVLHFSSLTYVHMYNLIPFYICASRLPYHSTCGGYGKYLFVPYMV